MTSNETIIENSVEAQELVITRLFDAPQDLVFQAFTQIEHLKYWWGPAGLKWSHGTIDLNPGGMFHYCFETPDGNQMWGKFTYLEIDPPVKLSYTNSFSDEVGKTVRAPFNESWPLEVLNTVTFADLDGKTEVTLRGMPINVTDEERTLFESMFPMMNQGFAGTLDQLENYLKSL